jgi:hypothetical protein
MYTSDALNWRFSKMTRKAGLGHWHAHEGRHTAVSIMSSNGVPTQQISDTVGHKSTHVTETVYRHVIVPAIRGSATVMDDAFGPEDEESAQTESGTQLGTFRRTGLRETVELRGFEPLTFCMPCTSNSSEAVPLALFPQVRALRLFGAVVLGLTGTGGVGTWLVTGFPDLSGQGRGITDTGMV